MMHKKLKIAFCFSGQARTLDQTYLFFQRNLFDAAKEQGFDYDVFCAIEDDKDVDKVNLLNPTRVEKIKSGNVEKIIEEKYGDFIRNDLLKNYSMSGNEISIKNCLQMFYKNFKVINLAFEHLKNNKVDNNKYDVVMKLRFDLIIFCKLDFIKIKLDTDKNNVICNNIYEGPMYIKIFYNRINYIQDFFFIGNMSTMKVIGDCFMKFKDLFVGHHVKTIFRPFFIFQKFISNLNIKLHYKIRAINYMCYLLSFLMYQTFQAESIYYIYLNKFFKVVRTNIPDMILKYPHVDKSIVKLTKDSKYLIE